VSDAPPQPRQPGRQGGLLLAVLSLAGLAVVAWACLLAWAVADAAVDLFHWLS